MKTSTDTVTGGTVKPNTLVFHETGTLSVRIAGSWRRNLRQVTGVEYLALKPDDRERIVVKEFYTGRSLIVGHEPLVTRPQ